MVLAVVRRRRNSNDKVVAVVGDGSCSSNEVVGVVAVI